MSEKQKIINDVYFDKAGFGSVNKHISGSTGEGQNHNNERY